MTKKEEILAKIPRYSTGRIKGDEMRRVAWLLENYKFSDQELALLEKQVDMKSESYGHSGVFVPRAKRNANTRVNWI
jgi:hypothetical protein